MCLLSATNNYELKPGLKMTKTIFPKLNTPPNPIIPKILILKLNTIPNIRLTNIFWIVAFISLVTAVLYFEYS